MRRNENERRLLCRKIIIFFNVFVMCSILSGCNREANLISDSEVPEVVENEMESNQIALETEYSSDLQTEPIPSQEHESTETLSFNETAESENVESTPVAEESREVDLTDYSAYLRKIWIVDGWEGGDYPVSFVITKLENGEIQGYLKFRDSVDDYYFALSRWKDSLLYFQGRIYDGTAECKYIDTSQNRQEEFRFMFCGNDRIQAELGDDEEQQYLLRPYNIFTDVDLCGKPTLFEVDLDSWGTVLTAYANSAARHTIPYVAMINSQGDILYKFSGDATYVTSLSVYDVIVADMNGDGRKDVKVITFLDFLDNDNILGEAYFYQIENGMFYLGLENTFTHEEPYSYYYSREGDLVLEKVIEEKDEKINCDITWDDYNSGSYGETWLHFSFSDGTEVDEELSCFPSIVENVDFVDITGDGKDEVLIYRYFANTATEYTLINIFQIEENCVTEISPELELEELANNVWDVIDIDFSEEEYDMPVFTMESYEKINTVTYPDKRVLVGYQGGGWQILRWID